MNCQYACPAHTPVPHYIQLITEGRYAEAYMVNWQANVLPGILAGHAIGCAGPLAAARALKAMLSRSVV
jgi:hypothetical protein